MTTLERHPGGARLLVLSWFLLTAYPCALPAQEAKSPGKDLDLAKVKQEEARQMLDRLEDSMDRLARLLAANEPQNAAKLRLAFRQARERLLREGMERIVAYLKEKKLDRALDEQGDIKVNMEEILAMLLEKDIDPRELLKHIRRLRDLVKNLDDIVSDETKEKLGSDDASQAEASTGALAGDLAKLEDLIRRQKALEAKTKNGAAAEKDGLADLAPEQEAVRKETKALREKDSERGAAAKKGSEGPSAEKPGEPGPDGGKPGEAADQKPGQPGQPGPAGQPGQPGEARGGQPPEAGPPSPEQVLNRDALARAEGSMREAEKAMNARERAPAAEKAAAARKALEEALDSGKDRLERLRARRNFKKLKEDQDRTRDDAGKLAARMNEPPPLVSSPEEGVPGRSDVEASTQDMESASQSLGGGRPRPASRSQGTALNKLKQGREKTEAALEELQRALRDRILSYLREKFTRMLEEQRGITRSTHSLELKLRALRAAAEAEAKLPFEIDRKDRQLAGELASREEALTLIADDVIDLLSEDGTTLVFPEVVAELKDDLRNVSGLVSRFEIGEKTQYLQRQIEQSIEEILKALDIAQKSPPPPNPNQGRSSKSGAGPLLPASAELKMVRSLQLRVNERTQVFDVARPEGEIAPEAKLQLHAISKKQKEVENMLRKLSQAMGER